MVLTPECHAILTSDPGVFLYGVLGLFIFKCIILCLSVFKLIHSFF